MAPSRTWSGASVISCMSLTNLRFSGIIKLIMERFMRYRMLALLIGGLSLSMLAHASDSIRRVVTSENENGTAQVYIDDSTPHVIRQGNFSMGEIWANDHLIIEPVVSDNASGKTGKSPSAGDTLMRYVVLPPDKEMAELVKRSLNKSKSEIKTEPEDSGMHQTDTIDYGFILQGSIVLDLGSEKVILNAGDSFVQNGTRHAWRNPNEVPAIIGVVMIGASRQETLNKAIIPTP